ncbi:hypothetical protein GCM10020295_13010 [Streptomyces cinereospinus]
MAAAPGDGRTRTAPAALPDPRPGGTAAVPLPFVPPADADGAARPRPAPRVATARDEPWAPRGTVVDRPRTAPVRRTRPGTGRTVEVDADGLPVHPLLLAARPGPATRTRRLAAPDPVARRARPRSATRHPPSRTDIPSISAFIM